MRFVVRILHKIYERSRNEMRQMGNGRNRAVVGSGIDHIGICKHGADQGFHARQHFGLCVSGRAEQIENIFKEQSVRVAITALLGTCHRVTAHKLRTESETQNLAFYVLFAAADIGNQGVRRQNPA